VLHGSVQTPHMHLSPAGQLDTQCSRKCVAMSDSVAPPQEATSPTTIAKRPTLTIVVTQCFILPVAMIAACAKDKTSPC
jgi:hypothetical protein